MAEGWREGSKDRTGITERLGGIIYCVSLPWVAPGVLNIGRPYRSVTHPVSLAVHSLR